MKQHWTSSEPNKSIGRWRRDLSPSLQAVCQEAFSEVLKEFGYDYEMIAEYRKHGANMTKERIMDTPSIKHELKDLILKSLNLNYTSESCMDSIKTGNHYQSLTLGEAQTVGFRTDRKDFLDEIKFEGKKVLDLGSNLGEISRAARARGACLVDGFEYDSYFLEIAHAVNAYNGVTRVSFYQRDITNPSVYEEHYDIVLAFSVFTYIHSVLERIADITDQLLILETHKLEGNLDSQYLKPVSRHFPYYHVLGESEWGVRQDANEKRAVIVFAKRESAFPAALRYPGMTGGYTEGLSYRGEH
jgi:2-polyprenyl-3-methyl-5-hydroxy-6-metoxy-1,4-benzoquinol methylase